MHVNKPLVSPVKLPEFSLPKPLKPFADAGARLFAHDGFELAGFIAYTALVSIFPFTIFLFSLAGFIHQGDAAQRAIEQGFAMLPYEVRQTIWPILQEILKTEQPGLLTVGILGTLWATSAGVEALRMGLGHALEVKESRAFWRRKLSGFGFVALGALAMIGASLLVVAGPLLIAWTRRYIYIPEGQKQLLDLVRYAFSMALLIFVMAVLYRYLPAARTRWRQVLPGACFATFLWLLLASLFSLYLSHSGDYTVTYGSLGGVVITLLFLQFSALLFLYGAEVNAVIGEERGT